MNHFYKIIRFSILYWKYLFCRLWQDSDWLISSKPIMCIDASQSTAGLFFPKFDQLPTKILVILIFFRSCLK